MTAHTARRLPLRAALGLAAAGLAFAVPAAAQAHVTANADDAAPGAYTVVTFSVPHGCDGSATTKVAIDLPESIDEVTPTRNPYYDVTTKNEKLAKPRTDAHGNEVTERESQVVYTAKTPLPDGQRDTFELSLQIPEDADGTTLTFPTTQTCEKGETAWTQVPKKGQSEDDLESPAPAVAVAADDDSSTATATAQAQAAMDGTTTALVVTSLVIGALGLLTGAAALITVRRRR